MSILPIHVITKKDIHGLQLCERTHSGEFRWSCRVVPCIQAIVIPATAAANPQYGHDRTRIPTFNFLVAGEIMNSTAPSFTPGVGITLKIGPSGRGSNDQACPLFARPTQNKEDRLKSAKKEFNLLLWLLWKIADPDRPSYFSSFFTRPPIELSCFSKSPSLPSTTLNSILVPLDLFMWSV